MAGTVKGRFITFKSKTATNFYRKILRKWPTLIKGKKAIVFLPCASYKPIQLSPTHCFLAPVSRYSCKNILFVIVSEPLTLVPYMEKSYPNYDYPPKRLREDPVERAIFVKRLQSFKKKTPDTIKCYYIGGKHHYDLLKEAGWNVKYFHPKRGIIDYHRESLRLAKHLNRERIYTKNKIELSFKLVKINTVKVELEIIEKNIKKEPTNTNPKRNFKNPSIIKKETKNKNNKKNSPIYPTIERDPVLYESVQ